ncbi:MAG: alkaline phosphatase D family protein [Asticcacaulis sp.]
MGNGRVLLRIPEPAHEIVSLADYRTRHAQYKRDQDLQAAPCPRAVDLRLRRPRNLQQPVARRRRKP